MPKLWFYGRNQMGSNGSGGLVVCMAGLDPRCHKFDRWCQEYSFLVHSFFLIKTWQVPFSSTGGAILQRPNVSTICALSERFGSNIAVLFIL